MTVTLPHDPSIGDGYDTTPGGNADPPPKGAPEGQAPSTVNDAMRDTKAACAQNDANIVAVNAALGTMAEQDANAVTITGGTISGGTITSGATVAVAATLGDATNNVSLQGLFDLIYPVDDAVVLRHDESPPPAWPGISATWTLIAEGFYLKVIQSGQTVGETFGSTTTDSTVLTEANLPALAHSHKMFTNEIVSNPSPSDTDTVARSGSTGAATDYSNRAGTIAATLGVTSTVSSGSGTGHTHDYDPPTYRIALYRRTA